MHLIKYEAARTALSEAHRIDEVKDIRDKAEALRAYARQAGDIEMVNWAAEIKVRAERKAGELLIEMKDRGERHSGHGDQIAASSHHDAAPTLPALGITRDQSSRWQKKAAIPEPEFEAMLAAKQAMRATTYSHESLEYYTPAEFVEAAREVMGGIDLDPASCEEAQKVVRASRYYSDGGLALTWSGRVFLNPPYSKTDGKSNQGLWSAKLADAYSSGEVAEGVLLVKAALGYVWFEHLFLHYPCAFVRERLSFTLSDGSSEGQSKQGTAFFYFGSNTRRFYTVFSQYGRVIPPGAEVDALWR